VPLKCVTPEEFNNKIFYTIDPGIHTAIQKWHYGVRTEWKVYNAGAGSLAMRIGSICSGVDSFIDDQGIIIIEGVDIRATSEVSMASAGRGNLSFLAYMVGAIMNTCWDCSCHVCDPVLYREWAGQLSYDQLRNILKKKFKIETPNEHIAAAVGIGLAAKGDL